MPEDIHKAWLRTVAVLALLLVFAGLGGAVLGHPWEALALAALAVIAWHYWRLHRILARLTARRRLPPPDGSRGAWNELDRLLHRTQDETRSRKNRLLEMLRAYRAAAAALPDAVVVVERNSQRVLWFNEIGTSMLGLRYPESIGAPLAECLRPLPLARWLASGRHAEPLEVASPDGSSTLSLKLIPYSDSLWLLVARDITRLLSLERTRSDFVANVSHELRTPLTVLHGYLDLMDDDGQPGRQPMIREMQQQSRRMAQLVEDLLMLSRLESADQLANEDQVPMAAMLDTLRREAVALGHGRHRIRVEDQAGVDLWGSARELHSAFSNLVSNAVRHTAGEGGITIGLRRAGDGGVLLEVADSGYGIAPAHLPRLTERFYRVSASRSRESGGTGLGLAIVKHALHLHQGRLTIASEVGVGSTFTCHFGPARVRPRSADAGPER
ncbi:phosphate regulon sensor histidine kinase PhoR [Lysobacter sp. GX 14042]|uniref:phosphate regulon sensor histidine kinase PhoR n=1 Tax=Lysobacter sp. GX 14042 TaxID=2907155 RepID=UPI001F1A585C|nr:phosphate regulon sensor histidine kinase PhoR [Lysobacter sp. GX 14042]MCE7032495.1 phosphate regulon sensor histidine kinase PhoR [Lysobacter sp. GX 14042]